MNIGPTTAQTGRWEKIGGVSLLLAGVLVGFLPFVARDYTESDLYALAGARMRAGEEIYRLDERPFTYPPLLGVPCIPLSYFPVLTYRFLWYLSVCGTLGLIVFLVMRRVRATAQITGSAPSLWIFWGVVLALAGRHLLSPVENQSHDLLIFLCALLAIDAWSRQARDGDVAIGIWAGLAAALKATPLLFLPVLLWQRRWRAAGSMILVGLTLTLATDVFWPRQDGNLWSVVWYRTFLDKAAPGELATTPAWDPWCPLNQSLSGTLQRLLSPLPASSAANGWIDVCVLAIAPFYLRMLTLTCLGAVFAWLLWVARPSVTRAVTDRQREFLRLGQGGLLLIAMTLLSPTSIKTHFAVLLLPIAVCVADYLWHGRDRVTGFLLTAVFLISAPTTKDMLGQSVGNAVMTGGSVTLTALILLAATGRVVLLRSRQWRAESFTRTESHVSVPQAA